MSHVRGVRLIPMPSGTTLVRMADGGAFRFSVGVGRVADLIESVPGHPDGTTPELGVARLIDLLQEHGSWYPAWSCRDAALPDRLELRGDDDELTRRLSECLSALVGVQSGSTTRPGSGSDASSTISLVCIADQDLEALVHWSTTAEAEQRPWLPVWRGGFFLYYGPICYPDGPLNGDDLAFRLAANGQQPVGEGSSIFHALGPQEPTEQEWAWALSVLAVDIERMLTGHKPLAEGAQVELDTTRLAVVRHPLLPHPLSSRLAPASCGPEALQSPRTGIIRSLRDVEHHGSIPRALHTVHSHNTSLRAVSPWQNDPVSAGTSFDGVEQARAAAIGEAVERYCCDVVDPRMLVHGSWVQLSERGLRPLDPERLVLFSDEQHAAPGFPFVRMDRQLEMYWVRSRSLTRDEPALLPASLVYGNWYNETYAHTPRTNNTFFPGIAAGSSLDAAVVAGVLEVIERHATMTWWANGRSMPVMKLTPRLRAIWEASGDAVRAQRRWLMPLPNEFGIPVVAGVVENVDEGLLTVGFAARANVEAAAEKAWAEALTLQDGARDLQRRNGGYWQSVARGEVLGTHVKPWREDRRYLDSYRADFRDVVDLMSHLQISLDPRAVECVRPVLESADEVVAADLDGPIDVSLPALRRQIEDVGYEVFVAELTTADVRPTGLRVARTIIPGLVPNYAAGLPFLGKRRLQQVPLELGWRSAPLSVEELNHFPMPHA